jgi:hypothetical protein
MLLMRERFRTVRRSLLSLIVIALMPLSGCGGSESQDHLIVGDESFAGMPNPGTLAQAIQRFGPPDELYSPDPEAIVACSAAWEEAGFTAQFRNYRAIGESGPPCQPAGQYTLSGAMLRGDWVTDRGLRVGDNADDLVSTYHLTEHSRCYNPTTNSAVAWTIEEVPDELGGPGATLCTLGAIVSHRRVTGFVLSNLSASE